MAEFGKKIDTRVFLQKKIYFRARLSQSVFFLSLDIVDKAKVFYLH